MGEHDLPDPLAALVGRLLLIALAALVGASACRRAPTDEGERQAAGPSVGSAEARLVAPVPAHDFGRVLEGDPLRYAFTITNAGPGPVRIARVDRSPACRPSTPPPEPIGPGASATIAVECDSRNRLARLVDAIFVHADGGGPPLRLELRATIDPLLAFETSLVTLETRPQRPVSRIVRLVGPFASRARLEVKDVGAAVGLRARPLAAGDRRGPGLELSLSAVQSGEHAGRVRIATGLDRPSELILPYLVRVKSTIEVDPVRPYFNLHDPAGRSRVLSVRSARPGFRIRRAVITAGPFAATLEQAGEGQAVRVSVDEGRLSGADRGVLGTLVLFTNDPAEPRKEIQLFALGAVDGFSPHDP